MEDEPSDPAGYQVEPRIEASARCTAATSGVISLGRFFAGNRMDMAPGAIPAAKREISAIGLNAR